MNLEPFVMEQNDKMGFNHFCMFATFQYRGLIHLELHCTLTIEPWQK